MRKEKLNSLFCNIFITVQLDWRKINRIITITLYVFNFNTIHFPLKYIFTCWRQSHNFHFIDIFYNSFMKKKIKQSQSCCFCLIYICLTIFMKKIVYLYIILSKNLLLFCRWFQNTISNLDTASCILSLIEINELQLPTAGHRYCFQNVNCFDQILFAIQEMDGLTANTLKNVNSRVCSNVDRIIYLLINLHNCICVFYWRITQKII
jgi:hypothetical protein